MTKNCFEVIPAIDILDGKCVRLTQGKYNLAEEFSNSPEEIAKRWIDCGAKRLHVVDLNGAKEGYPVNYKTITNITKLSPNIKVQVGGGIRTKETIEEYFNNGISYVILGTKAFQDNNFLQEVLELHTEKIILGLDLKNGKVALAGWQETKEIDVEELSKQVKNIKQIIYTDISKDGTLSGPNLKSIKEVASSFKSEIIVSGGISSLEDIVSILNIRKEDHPNISGVILGKSLYKGHIDLSSAIELTKLD